MAGRFEAVLTGGQHNSLGLTKDVIAEAERFEELYACYRSSDEVVRLRTSSALRRWS